MIKNTLKTVTLLTSRKDNVSVKTLTKSIKHISQIVLTTVFLAQSTHSLQSETLSECPFDEKSGPFIEYKVQHRSMPKPLNFRVPASYFPSGIVRPIEGQTREATVMTMWLDNFKPLSREELKLKTDRQRTRVLISYFHDDMERLKRNAVEFNSLDYDLFGSEDDSLYREKKGPFSLQEMVFEHRITIGRRGIERVFIKPRESGRLTEVISCKIFIENNSWGTNDDFNSGSCQHRMQLSHDILDASHTLVKVSYHSRFLPQWKSIAARTKNLLKCIQQN